MKDLKTFLELLKLHGYTMKDVDQAFKDKEKELGKKEYVTEKPPLEEKPVKRSVGRFVALRQADYPVKMFVLQEIDYKKGRKRFESDSILYQPKG